MALLKVKFKVYICNRHKVLSIITMSFQLKNHSAKKAIDDASKRKIHQRKQLLNKWSLLSISSSIEKVLVQKMLIDGASKTKWRVSKYNSTKSIYPEVVLVHRNVFSCYLSLLSCCRQHVSMHSVPVTTNPSLYVSTCWCQHVVLIKILSADLSDTNSAFTG